MALTQAQIDGMLAKAFGPADGAIDCIVTGCTGTVNPEYQGASESLGGAVVGICGQRDAHKALQAAVAADATASGNLARRIRAGLEAASNSAWQQAKRAASNG